MLAVSYFLPQRKFVQQFPQVAPEVLTLFFVKLSFHRGSPSAASAAHSIHSSQNVAFSFNIQLEDNCDELLTMFDTGIPRLLQVSFRGSNLCTKPASRSLNCTFEVSHTQQWRQPVSSQEQRPEPPPPESPIYYGTRKSREEAFSGKCDENRKQESNSPVSTFHRQFF